jgi:hypothetical protein
VPCETLATELSTELRNPLERLPVNPRRPPFRD